MMVKPKLIPAKNFGPGYFIREQMEYRNMSVDNLSNFMKVSIEQLIKVLVDKQPLTTEMACKLSNIFGTSTKYWLNLNSNYRKNHLKAVD